jgi:hypothetical protein
MADLNPLGLNNLTVDGTQVSFDHGITTNSDGTLTLKTAGIVTWTAFSQGETGTVTFTANNSAINFDAQLNLYPEGTPVGGPTPFSFGVDIIAWNADSILLQTSNVNAQYMIISDQAMTNGVPADTTFGTTGSPPFGLMELPCFVAGTRIATPSGETSIELLRVDDIVMTISGTARRVTWVGSRAVDCRRHPDPKAVTPIRISAGAFGEDLPRRDLFLSPEHCIYAEGVLIPAKALVNGSTVAAMPTPTVVQYHHIELDSHDVVFAEGLPTETFLETGNRDYLAPSETAQANSRVRLRGDATLNWEAHSYARLAVWGEEVDRVRSRLAEKVAPAQSRRVRVAAVM